MLEYLYRCHKIVVCVCGGGVGVTESVRAWGRQDKANYINLYKHFMKHSGLM